MKKGVRKWAVVKMAMAFDNATLRDLKLAMVPNSHFGLNQGFNGRAFAIAMAISHSG